MTTSHEQVDALVLAGGQGRRLGLGPKALLELGGRTLLRRAIEAVRPVACRVIVGVPHELVDPVRQACADDVIVLAGGASRLETTRILLAASTAPLVIQHDVVHPFVTAEIVRAVVAGARRSGAAMAVVEEGGHGFTGWSAIERRFVPDSALWLARKPMAFLRAVLEPTMTADALGEDDGTAERLLRAGVAIEPVPVPPWNLKVTGPDDWTLAQVLAPFVDAGALGPGVARRVPTSSAPIADIS